VCIKLHTRNSAQSKAQVKRLKTWELAKLLEAADLARRVHERKATYARECETVNAVIATHNAAGDFGFELKCSSGKSSLRLPGNRFKQDRNTW